MSRPVKVSQSVYKELCEGACAEGTTISEQMRRRLERPAETETDTSFDFWPKVLLAALALVGSFLVIRFFGEPNGARQPVPAVVPRYGDWYRG